MYERVIDWAKEVLLTEAEAILSVKDRLGKEFAQAVFIIEKCSGRVITAGIGKSGIVARKVAATLSSTGTPAFFLHPSEALHGDLGMVRSEDVLLIISNSGETNEICQVIQVLKPLGVKIITLTGNKHSRIATLSDVVIDVSVPREACPLGLAPTSSTTASLAVGDAIAVTLAKLKNFNFRDFHRFHPGGHLGQRLRVPLREIMRQGESIPWVASEDPVSKAIDEMNAKGLGATLVHNGVNRLCGIFTDGDLRRAITKWGRSLYERKVYDVMTHRPKTILKDSFVSDALEMMERHLITVLPVVDERGIVEGIIHLHDLLGKGKIQFTMNDPF
ncbi:MAG: KpsF/GutQ family sugar-phosphate isomerase [Syntrophobacterales bacterium]|nr:KpsF/GutQ family sugar-phosphate isomerase [Syntrophobacterales bacterium]